MDVLGKALKISEWYLPLTYISIPDKVILEKP